MELAWVARLFRETHVTGGINRSKENQDNVLAHNSNCKSMFILLTRGEGLLRNVRSSLLTSRYAIMDRPVRRLSRATCGLVSWAQQAQVRGSAITWATPGGQRTNLKFSDQAGKDRYSLHYCKEGTGAPRHNPKYAGCWDFLACSYNVPFLDMRPKFATHLFDTSPGTI